MKWQTLIAPVVTIALALSALWARGGSRGISLEPEGALVFDVRELETGQPMPVKLTFLGVRGTPTPHFTRNDIGHQVADDAVAAYNRVMSATGHGAMYVPVGAYDVYLSRGPEYDLGVVRDVRVRPGVSEPAQVRATLRRAFATPGWVSGDFHVHAAPSPDSRVPMVDRLFEFVSDDVQVLGATDHNVVTDYQPLIADLRLRKYITSFAGDEVTTGPWGHFGAWPLPQDLEHAGHGAIAFVGLHTPEDLFRRIREAERGDGIINVHHPRIDHEIGYFNLGGLDSAHLRWEKKGMALDFDAIEVLNGYQDSERRSVDRVITDWINLLNHGHIVTATGNSDTHHLDHNIGGYPRNYVRVPDDRPEAVTPHVLAQAVRAHRLFFTTGPFVKLSVGRGQMGDLVRTDASGRVRVEIEVDAAPWIDVSTVKLLVDGAEARKWEVAQSTDPVRLRQSFDQVVPRDSWLAVRVDGRRDEGPAVGDGKAFVVYPFALTNPVFVDRDGDGKFRAPEQ
ncbi:MAG TPA: CehA/McbA family metallohydrolase [Polyangia bacterium]|nr:CehA/McbA family metallohydrolase [Polyangia bacterium]